MPARFVPAIIAGMGQSVSKLEPSSTRDAISNAIQECYIIIGQDVSAKTCTVQAKELHSDIIAKHKHFTHAEISLALRMGVKGDFGDPKNFPVMSIVNFNHWLRSYSELIRKEAFFLQAKHEEKEAETRSDNRKEEGEKALQSAIIVTFKGYCQGVSVEEMLSAKSPQPIHLMSVYYDYISRHELSLLSDQERKALYAEAKAECIQEKPRGSDFRPEVKEFNRLFEVTTMILAKAKALKAVFERYKTEGFEIVFPDSKII